MGYTHYWRGKGEFTVSEWAAICADARKILKTTRVKLWHEYDEPLAGPEITETHIQMNGAGDDGYETFVLTKHPSDFEFCKTAQKPYDAVVCAILISAHKHAPDVLTISSDGERADWAPGLTIVTAACGPGYSVPFED